MLAAVAGLLTEEELNGKKSELLAVLLGGLSYVAGCFDLASRYGLGFAI